MVEKFEKFDFEKSVSDLESVYFEEILNLRNPIIFDTNFLFTTFEFKLDIILELQRVVGGNFNLFIYEGTIEELISVERKGDKNKKFLPLISKMLKLYNFKVISSTQDYIDSQILENLDKRILVATNDKELRKLIWAGGYKVIYMRQKRYLQIN